MVNTSMARLGALHSIDHTPIALKTGCAFVEWHQHGDTHTTSKPLLRMSETSMTMHRKMRPTNRSMTNVFNGPSDEDHIRILTSPENSAWFNLPPDPSVLNCMDAVWEGDTAVVPLGRVCVSPLR